MKAAEWLPSEVRFDEAATLGLSWGVAVQNSDGGELVDLVKAVAG